MPIKFKSICMLGRTKGQAKRKKKAALKLRLEDCNEERRLDKTEEIKNMQVRRIFRLHLRLSTFLFSEINRQR